MVPYPSKAKSQDTSSKSPPKQHNYLVGDIFFLVNGNHIVFCPSGARESIAIEYIKRTLKKTGKKQLTSLFSVEPIANIDKIKLLKKEGVKSIALNASLYEASTEYIDRKTTRMTLVHGVSEVLRALFVKDKKLQKIGDMENLSIKLEISFDSRKKGGQLGKERLEKTASKIINDDDSDSFSIITGGNKKVTSDEIRISDKIKLTTNGITVFSNEARDALVDFLNDLDNSGVLEQ